MKIFTCIVFRLPLRDAVWFCLSSMLPGVFNSGYQEQVFRTLKMQRGRDPMFITAATLMELEAYPTTKSLIDATDNVDISQLGIERQWLFSGMSHEEVTEAFIRRSELSSQGKIKRSMKSLDDLEAERCKRSLDANL